MTEAEVASWQRTTGKRLLERVGVTAGQAVLDFGCGEGHYTRILASIMQPTGVVYALDKNQAVLDKLIRSVRAKGLVNVLCLNTSANMPLPLRNLSVDVVLLYDVLHLIGWSGGPSGETVRRSTTSDRRAVMKELFRISRPAGVVSVYCPHLVTHTDVDSEQDITRELKEAGFDQRDDFYTGLVHDNSLVRGHIVNFIKRGRISAGASC